MDRQPIQRSELIERYLSGRLSPSEEQAFEEAYLADPRLLEELELTERLRAGFKDHAAASPAPRPASAPTWLGFLRSPRYGLAASFVAVVALAAAGALWLQTPGEMSPSAARQTRVLPLVSVRGGGDVNVIPAPSADEWTVLLLDTGFAEYDSFNAVLLRSGAEQELARLNGMAASDGTVAFGLPGSALPPGRYEIRLEGVRRDGPAARAADELSRTPFTVAPAP